MIGKWNVVYLTGFKAIFRILDDETLIFRGGGLRGVCYNLKPSNNEEVFPSSQGWVMFVQIVENYKSTHYLRYKPKDDTLEQVIFRFDKPYQTYKGLSHFYATSISTRK